MFHTISSTHLLLLGGLIVFSGCVRNRPLEIPDAPPPYANFPAPQNFRNYSASESTYSGSEFANNPYNQAPTVGQPFASPSPPSFASPQQNILQSSSQRYTLEADADLWALVQDTKGVELEWLKMKKGDSKPISYSGPITVTCSSGTKLRILDNQNNLVTTKANESGISIVRLP
jgi:hypothetical protein